MRAQEREEQMRLLQERAISEFNDKQERRYRLGRALVITLGVLHLLNAVVVGFAVFDALRLILQLVPALLLLCGVAWSRYVLASYAVVDATLVLFVVCSQYIHFDDPQKNLLMVVFVGLYVLYDVITAALLYLSKAIGLYLYERKHRTKKIGE